MVLNTSKLSNGQIVEFKNRQLDLDQKLFDSYFVKLTKCLISGYIKKVDYSVEVWLKINSEFSGLCYKCGDEASFNVNLELSNTIDTLNSESSTFIRNRELDLDELVSEELLLNLPSKVVCNENCKGLCGTCGINLNYGKCNCDKAIKNNANNPFNELKKLLKK